MLYFENILITPDKKLSFTVKSTEPDVYITEVDITTNTYYNNTELPYKYSLIPDLVRIDYPELVYTENEGEENEYKHFGTSCDFMVDLTNVEMILADHDDVAFDLNKDLIIATAYTNENEDNAIVDCCHKKPSTGMAYYKYCMFNKALNYVKTLCNDCEINKDLIDFILRHNSLDLAIKCGDVELAIKLWNLLFNKNVKSVITKTCGCHGR